MPKTKKQTKPEPEPADRYSQRGPLARVYDDAVPPPKYLVPQDDLPDQAPVSIHPDGDDNVRGEAKYCRPTTAPWPARRSGEAARPPAPRALRRECRPTRPARARLPGTRPRARRAAVSTLPGRRASRDPRP